jgi:hypothetical protein
MTAAQQRKMARLEKMASRLLDRKSKQIDSLTPIEKELYGISPGLLTSDELGELVELLRVGQHMGGGSSGLPTASRERFRELIAKAKRGHMQR